MDTKLIIAPDTKETIWSKFNYWWYDFKHSIPYYHRLSRNYWKLRSIFINRQKWLTKNIDRVWNDKSYIIPTVLFNCLVDFVEGEKALEVIAWEGSVKSEDCAKFIRDCYNYIKVERPALQNRIEQIISDGYDKSRGVAFNDWLNNGTYEDKYPKLQILEKEISDKDVNYCMGICLYHEMLWT